MAKKTGCPPGTVPYHGMYGGRRCLDKEDVIEQLNTLIKDTTFSNLKNWEDGLYHQENWDAMKDSALLAKAWVKKAEVKI